MYTYRHPEPVKVSLDYGGAPIDVAVLAVQLALRPTSTTIYLAPPVPRSYCYVSRPDTLLQAVEAARQARIAGIERSLQRVERQAPLYTEARDYQIMRCRVEATQRRLRRVAREAAGAHRSCPVAIVEGDQAPALTGETWYWRTRGGTRISHPSAYSRSGWSSMVYEPSTLIVEVGRDWFGVAP